LTCYSRPCDKVAYSSRLRIRKRLAALWRPQGNYRFRADQGGAQYWSATADDCAVPGCTGVTVMLAPANGMVPNDTLSLTAYQPGSDTAMIQTSCIMPASDTVASGGPMVSGTELNGHLRGPSGSAVWLSQSDAGNDGVMLLVEGQQGQV